MKNFLFLTAILFGMLSCNSGQSENADNTEVASSTKVDENAKNAAVESEGYQLMVQKCYLCHFEAPNPEKRDQMIAPPMLRVQEHYKPSFASKEEFVEAVVAIVKNPSKENTLMPGTIKKFNIMPKLVYDDKELHLIAEALYDHKFGEAPKRGRGKQMMNGKLQLNDGKKWDLSDESMKKMTVILERINNFNSTDVSDFNLLGKEMFDSAKTIMLDKEYDDTLYAQIQIFFHSIEDDMHNLMSSKSVKEAKVLLANVKVKVEGFFDFFE